MSGLQTLFQTMKGTSINNTQLTEAKELIAFALTVTPAKAQYWLEKHNYPNNRPISRHQVDILKNAIIRGQFNKGTAIHFAVLNGMEYLLDGQHRLTAIVETDKEQPMTIVYEQVETFEQMAFIYARYDRHQKRDASDTFHAFGLEEKTGLQKRQIAKANYAVRLILHGFSFNAKDSRGAYYDDFDVMGQIEYYQNHIKTYYRLISGSNSKLRDAMLRRSTLSMALITLDQATRHLPATTIYEFWQRVADGDGLERYDPRLQLRDKLLTTRISGGDNFGRTQQVSLIDACRMVAVAWNAYVDKKKLARFSLPNNPTPIKLTDFIIPAKKSTGE